VIRPAIYVRCRLARDWRAAGPARRKAVVVSLSDLTRQWQRIARAGVGLAVAVAMVWPLQASAAERSRAAIRAFRVDHPCPITGQVTGPCRSGSERMVVDHIVPLCLGGADAPSNMRWQEYRQSRDKDRAELALCRWVRRASE
jgi:hypothetical protein